MTTVTENVDLPATMDPTAVVVTLEVVGEGGEPLREVYWQSGSRTVAGFSQFALSATGAWSQSVVGNADLLPSGTAYRRTLTGRQIPVTYEYATVPTTGGPYRWDQILTDAPASITDSALSAHAAQRVFDTGGLHGVVLHRWDRDGWTPFTVTTVNADGVQSFTKSVSGHRGRFTGVNAGTATVAGPGNLREFALHPSTNWADSEVRSLWWGPNFFSPANAPVRRPQMGHVHRYQVGTDGLQRGLVCWYNIFGGPNPEVLVLNLWEFDGVTLNLGNSTGGAGASISRSAVIVYATRIDAFDIAQHRVSPYYAATAIPLGAFGSITGMTDTTFNDAAAVTISSGSRVSGVVTVNTSTAHGLLTGDWVFVDATDNLYDGNYQVTVVDTDTFTYTQQLTDDAAISGGSVVRRWTVTQVAPGDALIGVGDRTANSNTDKTAGGFWTPDYPWRVFPYWVASRCVGNTLLAKQWPYGTPEPDWGDAQVSAAATITAGSPSSTVSVPTGVGLCGILMAHANGNDYAEYGDVEFRKL